MKQCLIRVVGFRCELQAVCDSDRDSRVIRMSPWLTDHEVLCIVESFGYRLRQIERVDVPIREE